MLERARRQPRKWVRERTREEDQEPEQQEQAEWVRQVGYGTMEHQRTWGMGQREPQEQAGADGTRAQACHRQAEEARPGIEDRTPTAWRETLRGESQAGLRGECPRV